MKTSFKIAIAAVAGFVAGSAAGFFFQGAGVTDGSAKGDIAKVSKFSKNVVSPTMSAFQEKLASNPDELKKATASLTILTSRMAEFDELVSLATIVSEGNEALASSLQDIQNAKKLAANARENGARALEAINAIAEGRKCSIDYEQAAQNLSLAFLMVDRQMAVGKKYVADVDNFLCGKNVEEYKDLALVRDLWAGYCAGEAALNSDKEELAYWQKQSNLLPESIATISLTEAGLFKLKSYDFTALQQSITVDNIIGLHDSFLKISNRESLHTLAANGAQAFIMNNRESFHALENVGQKAFIIGNIDDFRSMLNLSSGPMLEMDPGQLMRNSTPAVVDEGVLVVPATDGPMPQTREHILL